MEQEYIGGKHAVLEALRSGRPVHKIWLSEQSQKHWAHPIVQAAKQAGVVIQTTDKRRLDQMVKDIQHQGVIAQVAAYAYADLDDVLASAEESGEPPLLVILDEIEDPHNLGSILRTAHCTGVHGVIIPKRRSVGLTQTVAKTSAGAIEYVPVVRVTNIRQTIERLKQEGIWTLAADGTAPQLLHDIDLTVPLAIVIGNEHKGISRLVKENCDFTARLPMYGRIDSLNASVAAGVFMYEIVRQRKLG